MDFTHLHVFLTVAREKSFSRAAEKLYRTQPAVSIAIRKLEEWVQQPLLVRGREVELTDAGELLVEYADRLLNLRGEIQKRMDDLKRLRRGQLSVGANESSIHALLPVLARYRRLHPHVRITVHRVFARDIPREVLNHRFDLGITSYAPQDEKLAVAEFFRDELTFVVPPQHPLARRRSVDITEVGREIFVAHIVESPYRWRVIQLFQKHRVPLNREIELPTIESIKRCVEMGMGVAIVPRMCVRAEVERGQLVPLKIRQLKLLRHLYVIYRREGKPSHAAGALLQLLCRGRTRPDRMARPR